jgi:hypothetical protein
VVSVETLLEAGGVKVLPPRVVDEGLAALAVAGRGLGGGGERADESPQRAMQRDHGAAQSATPEQLMPS